MVSRPLRMTLAAASDSAKACARAPLTHDAPPPRPAYGLAQRRAPASLASRLHTAPRFAQPLACMLAAPHSVLWTRASAGRRKREVGSGPGTRRNPIELRLYIYVNKGLPPFHHAADRLSPLRSRERQHISPTALSDHVHSPESACINKEYINTFRHAEFVARHDPSRLSRVTPSAWVHASLSLIHI